MEQQLAGEALLGPGHRLADILRPPAGHRGVGSAQLGRFHIGQPPVFLVGLAAVQLLFQQLHLLPQVLEVGFHFRQLLRGDGRNCRFGRPGGRIRRRRFRLILGFRRGLLRRHRLAQGRNFVQQLFHRVQGFDDFPLQLGTAGRPAAFLAPVGRLFPDGLILGEPLIDLGKQLLRQIVNFGIGNHRHRPVRQIPLQILQFLGVLLLNPVQAGPQGVDQSPGTGFFFEADDFAQFRRKVLGHIPLGTVRRQGAEQAAPMGKIHGVGVALRPQAGPPHHIAHGESDFPRHAPEHQPHIVAVQLPIFCDDGVPFRLPVIGSPVVQEKPPLEVNALVGLALLLQTLPDRRAQFGLGFHPHPEQRPGEFVGVG